jgi:hypothetical protein
MTVAVTRAEPVVVVARWSAHVGADVADARFELLPGVEPRVAREAIAARPGWLDAWPPESVTRALGRLAEGSPAALALLALAKLASFLDFGAEVGGTTGAEIRAALRARYPGVAPRPDGVRFEVDASLREGGHPTWGFVTSGEALPGLPEDEGPGKPHLDLWLQNLARAEVHDRLDALLGA